MIYLRRAIHSSPAIFICERLCRCVMVQNDQKALGLRSLAGRHFQSSGEVTIGCSLCSVLCVTLHVDTVNMSIHATCHRSRAFVPVTGFIHFMIIIMITRTSRCVPPFCLLTVRFIFRQPTFEELGSGLIEQNCPLERYSVELSWHDIAISIKEILQSIALDNL